MTWHTTHAHNQRTFHEQIFIGHRLALMEGCVLVKRSPIDVIQDIFDWVVIKDLWANQSGCDRSVLRILPVHLQSTK